MTIPACTSYHHEAVQHHHHDFLSIETSTRTASHPQHSSKLSHTSYFVYFQNSKFKGFSGRREFVEFVLANNIVDETSHNRKKTYRCFHSCRFGGTHTTHGRKPHPHRIIMGSLDCGRCSIDPFATTQQQQRKPTRPPSRPARVGGLHQ